MAGTAIEIPLPERIFASLPPPVDFSMNSIFTASQAFLKI